MDKARDMLKSLLGATITLHPCADGVERYLTAEVTGDYAGLLTLTMSKNKGGGGQGFLPSLINALRFEMQGVHWWRDHARPLFNCPNPHPTDGISAY